MWGLGASALTAAVTSVVETVVKSVPAWVWKFLLGALAGALIGAYASHRYHTASLATSWSPTIEKAEQVDTTEISAEIWQRLQIHDPPPAKETDTTQAVLPEWMLSPGLGAQNALPEVTYESPRLAQRGLLPHLPYVAVPMRNGRRPAVDVGASEVRLTAINPKTGGALTYRYSVPSPKWTLSVAGTIGAASESLSGSSALVLERALGDWTVGLGGGYGLTAGPESLSRLFHGRLTIEHVLFQWPR